MMNVRWIALLLIAPLLAGCAATQGDLTSSSAAAPSSETLPVQSDPGPAVQAVDRESVFFLQGASGPDTPLRSFLWTIPEGSITSYQPFLQFGDDYTIRLIRLEVLPVFPDGMNGTVDGYAIAVLRVGETADLIYTNSAQPVTVKQTDLTGTSENDFGDQTVRLRPTVMSLSAGDLEPGKQVAFVLGVKTPQAHPVGLLFRVIHGDLGKSFHIETNQTRFLDNRTLVPIPVKGQGAGFADATYVWENFAFLPDFIETFEYRIGQVDVQDALQQQEPFPLPRDVTVSTSYKGHGHSEAFADFFGGDGGTWAANVDLHGTGGTPQSVLPPAQAGVASIVTGYPYFFGVGEGEGDAKASMHIQMVPAPEGSAFIRFLTQSQTDIGATWKELTGVDGDVGYSDGTGLVGNVPPTHLMRDGDDLLVLHGPKMTRLNGAALPIPGGVLPLLP